MTTISCLHELFEAQVACSPDDTAVICDGRRQSYRELNARANQLADFLRQHGAGPGTLVGICLPRCFEMMVALLGTLKAGAAYVPLDPAYPQERLSFMVADADLRFLLTDDAGRARFPSMHDRTICLDSDRERIARHSRANAAVGAMHSDLAYVMYTSGSTGKPKGAMITHRGLAHYVAWAVAAYGVKAGRSVPVHSSISFDLTVTSLYPALVAGGSVELLPEDAAGTQPLVEALRRTGNRGLIKITPAHLELLSLQFAPEEAAALTDVFVIGGENLTAESIAFWRRFAPATRLVNEYGPTETVVGCCFYEVQQDDPGHGAVPIGRPIAGTRLYVLDSSLRPVRDGEAGELCIGGAGVARGYLNRDDLTRERFMDDPIAAEPGARIYRSGDLARRRGDGVLEFLGRADNQIKVRGYRIEPGEIEETLAGHSAVQSSVVLASEDDPLNRRLVAYVVPRDRQSCTTQELRNFLASLLPSYMVPAQFVFLDALPLTLNGKVDRGALRASQAAAVPVCATLAEPSTNTQRALISIWSELLGSQPIGVDDDVFDLGAHSLMTMRAVTRIRDLFSVDLTIRHVFEQPTVAGLAEIVDQLVWASTQQRHSHPATSRVEIAI